MQSRLGRIAGSSLAPGYLQGRPSTCNASRDLSALGRHALHLAAILVGSLDVAPSFQEDQVQPSVGWPLVEMALQSGNSPMILCEQGAWCCVFEFAEEFGISASFEPFNLLERRGV